MWCQCDVMLTLRQLCSGCASTSQGRPLISTRFCCRCRSNIAMHRLNWSFSLRQYASIIGSNFSIPGAFFPVNNVKHEKHIQIIQKVSKMSRILGETQWQNIGYWASANRVNSRVDSPGSCAEAEDLRLQEQLIPEGPVISLHFLYQWMAIMQWIVLGKFGILKTFLKGENRVTSTASTLEFPKNSSMKQLGCSYCFEKNHSKRCHFQRFLSGLLARLFQDSNQFPVVTNWVNMYLQELVKLKRTPKINKNQVWANDTTISIL